MADVGRARLRRPDRRRPCERRRVGPCPRRLRRGLPRCGGPAATAAAWPLFFATAVVITVARLADDRFEPTWVILASAVALLIYGLLRGAGHPGYRLPLQTVALLGFGAAAAAALMITPELGAYLVAAGLPGHAAWDAYHHRLNRVVVRSLAEFCLALDAALAVVIVIVTMRR
jgi:hypothetical protein